MSTHLSFSSDSDDAIIAQLRDAAEGLLYPSESDEPFQCFLWHDISTITPDTLLTKTHNKPGTPLEEISLERFFSGVMQEADWMDEHERREAQRFQALHDVLTDLLTDIRIFRIGAMDIDVYLVGRTPSGTYVGLQTKVVET
jgi:hypothetical protein